MVLPEPVVGGDGPSVRVVATKTIGSLPVLRQYFEACGMREVLEELCPSAPQARISHADAVLALVCNRLTAPQPLYRVEDWARELAVEECLGLHPDHLNDDRLAETLDVIAAQSDAIYGSVAALAVERFKVDTRIIHRDLTDIAFHGGYEIQNQQFAQVMFGWPGANVPKGCKTMRQDVAVAEDGAFPVMMRSYSGNAADVNTVVDVMEALRTHARIKQCLLVGDTKILSEANLHRILLDGCDILAPMTKTEPLVREMLALDASNWKLMPYLSERQQQRQDRGAPVPRFYAQEAEYSIEVPLPAYGGELEADNQGATDRRTKRFALRKVYVLSEEERDAARASRFGRMERAEKELAHLRDTASNYETDAQLFKKVTRLLLDKKLDHLYRVDVQGIPSRQPTGLIFQQTSEARAAVDSKLEKRLAQADHALARLDATAKNYRTPEQLLTRVKKLLGPKKVSHLYTIEVIDEPVVRPTSVTFERDTEALTREERRDGLYALLTSASRRKLSTNDVLKTFKQQGRLEARNADLKGPLAVNPIYLKSNDRIVGLLLVLGLALMIYCLIERQARNGLENQRGVMQGLYPEGRYSRPTARQILRRLSTMTMVGLSVANHLQWVPVPPDPVQQHLFTLLRLPGSRDG